MKKILFIVEANSLSGAGKCAIELISHIKNNLVYEPIVITQLKNDINSFCDSIHVENYHIHYARTCSFGMGCIGWLIAFFMRPLLNRRAFNFLERKKILDKISIIHSNAVSIDFGAYIQKRTHIPHIWHIRDFLVFKGYHKPIIKKLFKYIDIHSSKIITVSNELKSYCEKKGINPEKIQTIYDGVQKQNFSKHSLSTTKKFVCVGNICPLKGQETLLKAIAKLPTIERKKIKLDFYGNCSKKYEKKLKKIILSNSLEDQIFFKGYSSQISKKLSDYDIGIQPSHSEGFSLVTAEYMAAGLCVIAANEGAIPELITNNETGFLYEDYNLSDLKEKIIFCLNHPDEIKKVRKNAYNKISNAFSTSNSLKAISETYSQVTLDATNV